MKITYICEKHGHHAAHHPLYRMAAAIGTGNIERTISYAPPSAPVRWLNHRLYRLSGLHQYTIFNLRDECLAALSILTRRNRIYHVVFGDDCYRYLGFLNGVRGARVVASFHQPPGVFERIAGCTNHVRRLSAVHVVASNQVPYFRRLVPEERVFLIPHPIDAEFFSPGPPVDRPGRTCIFVGQWLRDFEMMRRVILSVHERDAGVRFVIVTFPPRFRHFKGLGNVELRSGVSDEELRALYRAADLLVLPLEDCTFNNALLEAMACGLPVVSTDVGGVRDYADPSCAVLAAPGGTARDMADAVLALLGDDRRRAEMGRHAREKALSFHWEAVVPRMMEMYRAISE
ncbi:MAG: glycosyltransferase family 4 protein [Chlamydiota bacterium]